MSSSIGRGNLHDVMFPSSIETGLRVEELPSGRLRLFAIHEVDLSIKEYGLMVLSKEAEHELLLLLLERADPEFGQFVKEHTSCDIPVSPHSVFRRLIPPKYSPVCGYITLWVGKDCLTGEYTSTVYLVDEADTKLCKKFPTVEEAMAFVLDAPEPATEEWFDQLYTDDWIN